MNTLAICLYDAKGQ